MSELKWIIPLSLVLILLFLSVGSCTHASQSANHADLKFITSGEIRPVTDCFGDIVDYKLGDFLLIENGALPLQFSGDYGAIHKADRQEYWDDLSFFSIENYQLGKTYTLYFSEGNCLWWHIKNYYIGCPE